MTPTERYNWLAYDGMKLLPRADQLEDMDTISEGYTCDLKVERDGLRIWLHRTGPLDGEPYEHTVTIECRDDRGAWRDVLIYDGDDPADQTLHLWTEYEHLIDAHQRKE